MIKFFRNIRKQLHGEGKNRKYFKYAIGEILLVVIGILIALQINNWSESKKDQTFQLKMLTEIQYALETDIEYFKSMAKRLHKLDSASTHFIKLVHKKSVFIDSLYKKGFSRWYYLRTGINYQYNRGPYDALKTSGLDKVSNDRLRINLVDYFDFRLSRFEGLVNHSDRQYNEDVAVLESFLGEPFTELVNNEVKIYSKFPKNLLLNVTFLELLRNINTRAKITGRYINGQLESMKNLNKQLKFEIDK